MYGDRLWRLSYAYQSIWDTIKWWHKLFWRENQMRGAHHYADMRIWVCLKHTNIPVHSRCQRHTTVSKRSLLHAWPSSWAVPIFPFSYGVHFHNITSLLSLFLCVCGLIWVKCSWNYKQSNHSDSFVSVYVCCNRIMFGWYYMAGNLRFFSHCILAGTLLFIIIWFMYSMPLLIYTFLYTVYVTKGKLYRVPCTFNIQNAKRNKN